MKQLAAISVLSLLTLFYAAPASAQWGKCQNRQGWSPMGDFCPSCRVVTGPMAKKNIPGNACLSCVSGCYIETVLPQQADLKMGKQATGEMASCPGTGPANALQGEALSLALVVDAALIGAMEEKFPVAASFLAVMDWANDPSLIFDGRMVQLGFRHQPLKGTASAYFNDLPSAGEPGLAKKLPLFSNVLTTARASKLDDKTFVIEITSELVSKTSSEKIEGPIFVLLRASGEKAVTSAGTIGVEASLVHVESYSQDRALLK